MANLGVITDGISRDFERALTVMNESGLEYAELQFLWDKEVGDLQDAEMTRVENLAAAHKVKVSCISRHIFGGLLLGDLEKNSPAYLAQIDALRRCIEMAKGLDCPLVRVMSSRPPAPFAVARPPLRSSSISGAISFPRSSEVTRAGSSIVPNTWANPVSLW